MTKTGTADPVMTGVVCHQQSKTAGVQTVPETGRVLVNISQYLAVQLAGGSTSSDSTQRVILQKKLFRLALTSCWSGGRLSLTVGIITHKMGTEGSSENRKWNLPD